MITGDNYKKGKIEQLKPVATDSIHGESTSSHGEFISENGGTLYMTVNDIYLSDAIKDSIIHDNEKKKALDLENLDSLKIKNIPADLWYNDNVGEILVNVVVTHPLATNLTKNGATSIFEVAYRGIERTFSHKNMDNLLKCMLFISAFLLLDWGIGYYLRQRKKSKQES